MRGPGFPLPERPEDPAEGQESALETPGRAGTALWRGHLPEEGLRAVFRADAADAAGELGRWLARVFWFNKNCAEIALIFEQRTHRFLRSIRIA